MDIFSSTKTTEMFYGRGKNVKAIEKVESMWERFYGIRKKRHEISKTIYDVQVWHNRNEWAPRIWTKTGRSE